MGGTQVVFNKGQDVTGDVPHDPGTVPSLLEGWLHRLREAETDRQGVSALSRALASRVGHMNRGQALVGPRLCLHSRTHIYIS